MSKTNTTKNVAAPETSDRELERQIKEALVQLNEEKQVKVSIPKALEKNIGPTLPMGINGVMIVLPVDGKEYDVPAPFKVLLDEYLANLTS